jgi:hypothetical protein
MCPKSSLLKVCWISRKWPFSHFSDFRFRGREKFQGNFRQKSQFLENFMRNAEIGCIFTTYRKTRKTAKKRRFSISGFSGFSGTTFRKFSSYTDLTNFTCVYCCAERFCENTENAQTFRNFSLEIRKITEKFPRFFFRRFSGISEFRKSDQFLKIYIVY